LLCYVERKGKKKTKRKRKEEKWQWGAVQEVGETASRQEVFSVLLDQSHFMGAMATAISSGHPLPTWSSVLYATDMQGTDGRKQTLRVGAQIVEHLPSKHEAPSSKPMVSKN
jgi:hypothetical protein